MLVYCEKVGRENYRVGIKYILDTEFFFPPFYDKEIGKNLEIFPTENLTNFAKFLLKFAKILKSKSLVKSISTYTCYLSLFIGSRMKCELFPILTHLSMKEGCLFVLFVTMRSIKLGCFRLGSLYLWKALEVEGFMVFGLAVQKFLNIELFFC